jgi:hypothetical protein
LLPSECADNFDAALCILDDGFRCVRPIIEETVPEYSETVDIDISAAKWRKIISSWERLLDNLDTELGSPEPFDYPPYSVGRWLTIQLRDQHVSHEDGLGQFRSFVGEVVDYLEQHLDTSDHITLTGL